MFIAKTQALPATGASAPSLQTPAEHHHRPASSLLYQVLSALAWNG